MNISPIINIPSISKKYIEGSQYHSFCISNSTAAVSYNSKFLKSYPVDSVTFSGKINNETTKRVIILIGAPNSGKGTLARFLSESFSMPYISGGDILRDKLKRGKSFGKIAEKFAEQIGSVPKYTQLARYYICNAIKGKLKLPEYKSGVVIEGFPRSIEEANMLKDILDKDKNIDLKIVYLDVKTPILYKRSANRFICDECNKTYSLSSGEKIPKCACGGNLIKRADDTPEILGRRLLKYEKDTLPLIDYYGDKVVKVSVEDSSTKSEEVLDKIISAMSEK